MHRSSCGQVTVSTYQHKNRCCCLEQSLWQRVVQLDYCFRIVHEHIARFDAVTLHSHCKHLAVSTAGAHKVLSITLFAKLNTLLSKRENVCALCCLF
jgi:hypothetical protein